jgi:signal transduction histidine kinase
MRQVLQNLIGNALKFHRKDTPPRVKVYAQLLPNEGTCSAGGFQGTAATAPQICQILVEDNGIGFDQKYLDRIFTVFQRLHGRGEYEGTGVGLAICRKIAQRHNGEITARSQPDQGATFILTLPMKQPKTD